MEPKYPECIVALTGVDSNAMNIIGATRLALRRHLTELRKDGMFDGSVNEELAVFFTEATSGDYDHLLQTCMRWVTVE